MTSSVPSTPPPPTNPNLTAPCDHHPRPLHPRLPRTPTVQLPFDVRALYADHHWMLLLCRFCTCMLMPLWGVRIPLMYFVLQGCGYCSTTDPPSSSPTSGSCQDLSTEPACIAGGYYWFAGSVSARDPAIGTFVQSTVSRSFALIPAVPLPTFYAVAITSAVPNQCECEHGYQHDRCDLWCHCWRWTRRYRVPAPALWPINFAH